jgi:hypothetical protein
MQVFSVRGLDRVSAEIRAAELRLEGHQTELVPIRRPSGSYNVVYWTTQKSSTGETALTCDVLLKS